MDMVCYVSDHVLLVYFFNLNIKILEANLLDPVLLKALFLEVGQGRLM